MSTLATYMDYESEYAKNSRSGAVELTPKQFRAIGYELVDRLADFLDELPSKPVTPGEAPAGIRAAMSSGRPLPKHGERPEVVVREAAKMLLAHSLFNGHRRFFGYITSSAAPIGAFGDLLAAVANCNVGAWKLAPLATEIEAQTIRWIAELIGYPVDCGGLLVSGGNMANLVGLLAARATLTGGVIRKGGMKNYPRQLCCYCSTETHTWLQKATDISGLGTDSIRWIATDAQQRINVAALRAQVELDRRNGLQPFMVIGSAGTVGTGAVDPLPELAAFCQQEGLWFHVDAAYGGFAANVAGAPTDLQALAFADSVAIDAHKWLYAPIEAGCVLVRNTQNLTNTFSYHPSYYNFETDGINYFDFGPQNSRGFRALKVWLALQQAGRDGYLKTIGEDMALSRYAFELFDAHHDFEAVTQNLSICTFRYVPRELRPSLGSERTEDLLNKVNRALLGKIESSGHAFLSNAVVNGQYLLRMCIVNFRTTAADIESLPGLIAALGKEALAATTFA